MKKIERIVCISVVLIMLIVSHTFAQRKATRVATEDRSCKTCIPSSDCGANPCSVECLAIIEQCHEITRDRFYRMIQAGGYQAVPKLIPLDQQIAGNFQYIRRVQDVGITCTEHYVELDATHDEAHTQNNDELTFHVRAKPANMPKEVFMRTPAYHSIALFRSLLNKNPVSFHFYKAVRLKNNNLGHCEYAECDDIVMKVTFNDEIRYYDISDTAPPALVAP